MTGGKNNGRWTAGRAAGWAAAVACKLFANVGFYVLMNLRVVLLVAT